MSEDSQTLMPGDYPLDQKKSDPYEEPVFKNDALQLSASTLEELNPANPAYSRKPTRRRLFG